MHMQMHMHMHMHMHMPMYNMHMHMTCALAAQLIRYQDHTRLDTVAAPNFVWLQACVCTPPLGNEHVL